MNLVVVKDAQDTGSAGDCQSGVSRGPGRSGDRLDAQSGCPEVAATVRLQGHGTFAFRLNFQHPQRTAAALDTSVHRNFPGGPSAAFTAVGNDPEEGQPCQFLT